MYKILYLTTDLRFCGPNQQLFYIIKYLDRDKFEPFVLTISRSPEESFIQNLTDINVVSHSIFESENRLLTRLMTVMKGKCFLQSFLTKTNPDLIHTQTLRPDFLASQAFSNIPKVCSVHGCFPEHYKLDHGFFLGNLMTYLHINAMRKASKLIGVSNAVGDNLIKKKSFNNVEVIQNGVDTSLYLPIVDIFEKTMLRRKLGLPESVKVWISSGHLSSRKNPLALISIWKKIFNDDNSNHLVFIGRGSLEDHCRQVCAGIPNIHFVGYVNNVSEYLKCSDYYISASRAEGFPNSVLEAMACGLPAVLSDIPPHQEILEMDSNVGALFKLDHEEDLIKAIQFVLYGNYSQLSNACLNLIQSSLSAERMSQRYQDVYTDLIKTTLSC